MAEGLPDLKSRITIDTSQLDGVGDKVAGLGKKLAFGLAGVAAGVGAFAAESARKFAQVGGEVQQLTRMTGASAETASKLRFAAEESGVGVDQLGTSLGILSKHLAANDQAAKDFGVSFKDAGGKTRPVNDVLLDIAEKFSKMPDGIEKNAAALKLFGRSGAQMVPFLNKGRAGLAELEEEAQKFGLVLNQDNLEAIKNNVKAQRQFHAALDGLRVQLGQHILPVMAKVTTVFTQFALKVLNSKGFATFKKGVTDLFNGLTKGTDAIGSAQTKFAAFGAAIRSIIKGIANLFRGDVKGFAGELSAAFGLDASSALFRGLERFGDAVKGFVDGVGKLIHGDIAGWAVDVATGLGFTEDSRLTDGLINLGNAVKAAFEWLFDHLDLLKRVGELVGGLLVAEKVAGGIFSVSRAVGDLLPKLDPTNTELGKLLEMLGKAAGKTFTVTVDLIQKGVGAVGDIGADIGKKVGEAISAALKQSFGDKATDTVVGAGAQTIADSLADKMGESGVQSALKAAFAGAFGGAIGAAFAGLAGSIATGVGVVVAGIAASWATGIASVPAVVALVVFRDKILGFLTRSVLPAVGRFFTSTLPKAIGQGLGILAGLVVFAVLGIPAKIIQFLTAAIPAVVGAAIGFGEAIGRGLVTAVLAIPGIIETTVNAVVGFFVALPGRIVGALVALPGLVLSAVNATVGFFLRLPAELPALAAAAISGVIGFFSQLPGAVVRFFGEAVQAVIGDLGRILDAIGAWPVLNVIGDILGKIAEGFRDGWRRVNELTGNALNEITSGVGNALAGMGSAVANAFGAVVSQFAAIASELFNDGIGLGRAIIQGIVHGITGVVGSVIGAVTGAVRDAVNAAKGALGIGSPSKVFAEIGRNSMKGFELGFLSYNADAAVRSALTSLVPAVPARSFSPAAPTGTPAMADRPIESHLHAYFDSKEVNVHTAPSRPMTDRSFRRSRQ